MDKLAHLIVILALLAFSVFRLVRYFKHGLSRRVTAIPGSAGILLESPKAALDSATQPSSAADSRSARFVAGLVTWAVWAGVNAILWLTLFEVAALSAIPVIWRLFVGVFANFYLYPFARKVGERSKKRRLAGSAPATG